MEMDSVLLEHEACKEFCRPKIAIRKTGIRYDGFHIHQKFLAWVCSSVSPQPLFWHLRLLQELRPERCLPSSNLTSPPSN